MTEILIISTVSAVGVLAVTLAVTMVVAYYLHRLQQARALARAKARARAMSKFRAIKAFSGMSGAKGLAALAGPKSSSGDPPAAGSLALKAFALPSIDDKEPSKQSASVGTLPHEPPRQLTFMPDRPSDVVERRAVLSNVSKPRELDHATMARLDLEAAAKVEEAARAIEAAFEVERSGFQHQQVKRRMLPSISPTPDLEAAAKVEEAARAIEAAFEVERSGFQHQQVKRRMLPSISPTPAVDVLPPCANVTCQAAASVAWAEFQAKRKNRAKVKDTATMGALMGATPVRIAPNASG